MNKALAGIILTLSSFTAYAGGASLTYENAKADCQIDFIRSQNGGVRLINAMNTFVGGQQLPQNDRIRIQTGQLVGLAADFLIEACAQVRFNESQTK